MSGKVTDYWTFLCRTTPSAPEACSIRGLPKAIGQDEELKALVAHARPGQPHANMILAAVHFLLLRGAEHPLKRFYGTVGGTVSAESDDPFPDFRDFVLAHRAAIEPLIETRVTNTNEIGRSALLASRAFAPSQLEAIVRLCRLIEIGPSAGLNMIWDSYGVRYRQGRRSRRVDQRSGAACHRVRTARRSTTAHRSGARDWRPGRAGTQSRRPGQSDDRDWLRALIWPDQGARLKRMDARDRALHDVTSPSFGPATRWSCCRTRWPRCRAARTPASTTRSRSISSRAR